MDVDELSYNVFYLLLRNEYKKKYEFALSKCWTICVPCGDSLREVSITPEFVDDHVLRPVGADTSLEFETGTHAYKIENGKIKLKDEEEDAGCSKVNIMSIEKGYNKEFQPYNIIIVDKPLLSKYRANVTLDHNKLQLNRYISSYKEAFGFLKELKTTCALDEIEVLTDSIVVDHEVPMEELKGTIQKLIREYWANTMRKQSLDVQRDARFQKLLSVALEMFIMHRLHDRLYGFLSNLFYEQNAEVRRKIDEFGAAGVTPDKLGVAESLAEASLPSAIVEFATLDSYKGPLEKLMCMKGTLEFIVAEIKGIMADKEFKTNTIAEDYQIKTSVLDADDLIPLLLYVIIKCHPQKLFTDIYYVENFVWSISPHDGLSYTLVSFKAAIALLEQTSLSASKYSDKEEIEKS